MAQATANGITIEYEQHGQGEPLLLVMGLGGQLTDWPEGFVDELVGAGFQVTVYDNRDIGLSTEFDWMPPKPVKAVAGSLARRPPKAGYTIPDMAGDAAGLLDALGIDTAHVVGMSMGGMIAQQLAIEHPGRTLSLTSIMSTTGNPQVGQGRQEAIAALFTPPPTDREGAIERGVRVGELVSGPHFDEVEARIRIAQAYDRSFHPQGAPFQMAAIAKTGDRTERLNQLDVPTLVIHGELDPLVDVSGGEATAAAIPGAKLMTVEDMGHDLPKPRWAEITAAIASIAGRI